MKKIVLIFILGLAITFANAQAVKVKKTKSLKIKTVKIDKLQKDITDNILKDYFGYSTLKAYKLDNNGSISYKVLVKKDTSDINLFYSKNGFFLRKEKPDISELVPVKTKKPKKDKKAKD